MKYFALVVALTASVVAPAFAHEPVLDLTDAASLKKSMDTMKAGMTQQEVGNFDAAYRKIVMSKISPDGNATTSMLLLLSGAITAEEAIAICREYVDGKTAADIIEMARRVKAD